MSPVVGVALLLALVVVLAAVLGGLVGIESPPEPTPQYGCSTEYHTDGEGNTDDRPYVVLTLEGGEIEVGGQFYIVDGSGNEVRWDAVWDCLTVDRRRLRARGRLRERRRPEPCLRG